mgnify:CR=1 FL=1
MTKLIDNAQMFVEANISRFRKTGVERMYLEQGNYVGIVKMWECYLLDDDARKHFLLVDEILGA